MSLGPMQIAIICIIVLLLFGPSQLPKIGRAMGDTIKELKNIGGDKDV